MIKKEINLFSQTKHSSSNLQTLIYPFLCEVFSPIKLVLLLKKQRNSNSNSNSELILN